MTRPEMIDECLRWDRAAIKRDDREARKNIWRVIDALGGAQLSARACAWLATLEQFPAVVEIREELGVDDAPMWAGRVSA